MTSVGSFVTSVVCGSVVGGAARGIGLPAPHGTGAHRSCVGARAATTAGSLEPASGLAGAASARPEPSGAESGQRSASINAKLTSPQAASVAG
jgi:hypothetical protein